MTEFILKRESLNTITDIEMAFGITKLLPPLSAVPEDFKRGNDYTKLLDSLFAGQAVPDGEIVFREGFDDADAPALMHRVVMAHLRSFEPKHEHKIAGLGYLLSLACDIRLAWFREDPLDGFRFPCEICIKDAGRKILQALTQQEWCPWRHQPVIT